MANPDRMFGDDSGLGSDKVSNWIGGILILVVFVIPFLYLVYLFIFRPESSSSTSSDTPDCYYSGDEYVCE